MPTREHFLARLLELPRVQDKEVRRGVFRQTIAALGLGDQAGAMSLAGVDPKALGRSIQLVWTDGFLDDLDFIAPSAAAVALYQIAGALPLASERRAIGRKVLNYLYKGNAETFAALASRMALGSTRPLRGAGIRARIALATTLRSSADSAVDRLSLAIVTRRELAREWIAQNAMGSLPDRRLAGRLLERAAREAAKRADSGDMHPLRVFRAIADGSEINNADEGDLVASWRSLLADRETLVWRHVAVARGLLCGAIPGFVTQIQADLSPDLSPTEWRRAATSIVARIAVDRERGLGDAMRLLDGPLMRRDPGVAMALVWGLSPVTEVEPEAAEELIEAIASISPITIADSLVDLRHQAYGFGSQAVEICANALRNSLGRAELDDGLSALARGILEDLETDGEGRELQHAVDDALDAFGNHGTLEAHRLAKVALQCASERITELEALDVAYHGGIGTGDPRQRAMYLLRDLDATLLESRLLNYLLLVDRPPGSGATGVEAIDDLDARMCRWLLDSQRRSATPDQIKQQATLHQRQLRTLLHLIDGGATDFGDDQDRRLRVRARWTTTARLFVKWIREQPKSRLTRAIIATVSRAFDALVRDGAAEPVDVFLYTAVYFTNPVHIGIVAEASMHPDVVQLLTNYLEFIRGEALGSADERAKQRILGFKHFLHGFPSQTTLRSEAFRTTAWTLVHALESMMSANSLKGLVPTESAADAGPLAAVEDAIGHLQQLVVGAERRCSDQVGRERAVMPRRHALAHAVENAVNTESEDDLLDAITTTARAAEAALPGHIAQIVTLTLPRLSGLQVELTEVQAIPLVTEKRVNLPDWLPARRILGGFYVLKQLGGGNVGTVFVVKRAEERHDSQAERFALKVPEYNATVARTMSEKEFLKLFREEAGALLSIPEHSNIAKFVTFDAGARPKPILVMELIEGVSCERIISSMSLTLKLALGVIEGVMAGLEAMHTAGIAHLDVKPSNAILRDTVGDAVLVDFGLAGRNVRPGCATLVYGAPEIWETAPGAQAPGPATAADVYALGCFAYEVMTGRTLFDGNSDVTIISAHITHDGLPPAINQMAQSPNLQSFAMFLYHCLRYSPHNRANITELRKEFQGLRATLAKQPWPLPTQ